MGHDDPSHPHAHAHPHEHGGDHHQPDHSHPPEPEIPGVPHEHRHAAPDPVATWVITCSDSRGPADDASGAAIAQELVAAGHTLLGRSLVRDDPAEIRVALEKAVSSGARAVVLTGGTGLSRRDITADTVEALFERRLPGFGELFRMLSFQEVGSAAMLSRATAGTWRGAMVFAVPGSPSGARLAASRLIAPELGHLLRELSR